MCQQIIVSKDKDIVKEKKINYVESSIVNKYV